MVVDLEKNFEKLIQILEKENYIDVEEYIKFNVKRGLRDQHGKGVLVGLTRISEVHGYLVDEAEKIPDEGRLLYRGIDIFELVKGFTDDNRAGYEEVIYLILFGRLPSDKELSWFEGYLASKRNLPQEFIEDVILKNASQDIMNALQRSVLALYSLDKDPDGLDLKNILLQGINLIAKMPTLMAYAYKANKNKYDNQQLVLYPPKKEYGTAENILYMIRENGEFTEKEVEILDLILVIHAEHGGGNNSSFTNYVISSSGTDTYSAISAAIGSLKGPKHGGANKKVLEMMSYISSIIGERPSDADMRLMLKAIVEKQAFDKTGLIYGMGHAVYTMSDPRAVLLKEKAKEIAIEKNCEYLYDFFAKVEDTSIEIFKELKGPDFEICANVDFYSGFIYTLLEIPLELFTPLFVVARITGWCAHRLEQRINDPRIVRPAYKSIYEDHSYINIKER